METSHIFIGCWWFWSKIYSKTACISTHRIHQEKSPCGCRLDRLPVLWNQTRLEIWSEKERWSLYAKLFPQRPPWIPTTISKDTPTKTPQMGTPKLWIKNTMVQRGKFIRDPTRTGEKKSKSGGKVSILWTGSQPNVTSGTRINCSSNRKTKNKNRGCSTLIFRILCNLSKCKTTILCHKHDTYNPQRGILLIRTQGLQKSRK